MTTLVDNPYGFAALWVQGDLVVHVTLGILAVMSASTWYIFLTKLFDQWRLFRMANAANRTFWRAPALADGLAGLQANSPFRTLVSAGQEALHSHQGRLADNVGLAEWVGMAVQRSVTETQNRLQDGLALLATVASTAPFVGLFGTVWGIYHALTAIGIAGQASIDKVAGPVGEALIMTAIGLAVAVPAVMGFNWLQRRNKLASERLRAFAADLHGVLLGSADHAIKTGKGCAALHPVG